jgi:hypothetical protein
VINADENISKLRFSRQPSYELTNSVIKGGRTIGWSYEISIYIENYGDRPSEEMVVNLTDSEGFTLKKITYFEPGEEQIVEFLWSTINSRDQTIHVSYMPADLDATHTEYNKADTSFKISINNEDSLPAATTPGFEFIIVIMALIGFVFIRKKIKIKK